MAKSYAVRVAIEMAAPPAAVWQRVSTYEDTPSWIDGVKSVTLEPSERTGQPRNGVGAFRVVTFRPRFWTPAREEIVHFDPPRAFHYVVRAGMPALTAHLGKVIVDDLGNGRSRLRWEVDFTFGGFHPFRLLAPSVLRDFEAMLKTGLAKLKTQLENAGAVP
jgi:carbon monoxide dehydrogenase subunit G